MSRNLIEKVKKIIHEVINSNPDIITDDDDFKPIVRFDEMAESSINFSMLVWVRDRDSRFSVNDYLNTNLYKRFNEENIDVGISIFLHKYDPNLSNLDGFEDIDNIVEEKLLNPISELIPANFEYKIFKTTIFTVFEKDLIIKRDKQ